MRQSKLNPMTLFWPVLLALVLSLSACSKDEATDGSIRFSNYYPDNKQDFCIYKSEYIFGQIGDTTERRRLTQIEREDPVNQLLTKLVGRTSVPYTSGTLRGGRYLTWSALNKKKVSAVTVYKDNNTLKFLGYSYVENDLLLDWWYGADCNLGSHPSVWSFGIVKDGEIHSDDTEFYWIDRTTKPPNCAKGAVFRKLILTKVATVQLEDGSVYDNAVIFYYLDLAGNTYVNLDMDGIDIELGITLPTASETGNVKVYEVEIYGRDTGLIASGHFDANGNLHHFIELTDVVDCTP